MYTHINYAQNPEGIEIYKTVHSSICFRLNIHSVGGDVPVDSEAPVVTLLISRSSLSAQYFGGAHTGRVCVCAFIGVSVCA
jgi:hypothetical protein